MLMLLNVERASTPFGGCEQSGVERHCTWRPKVWLVDIRFIRFEFEQRKCAIRIWEDAIVRFVKENKVLYLDLFFAQMGGALIGSSWRGGRALGTGSKIIVLLNILIPALTKLAIALKFLARTR